MFICSWTCSTTKNYDYSCPFSNFLHNILFLTFLEPFFSFVTQKFQCNENSTISLSLFCIMRFFFPVSQLSLPKSFHGIINCFYDNVVVQLWISTPDYTRMIKQTQRHVKSARSSSGNKMAAPLKSGIYIYPSIHPAPERTLCQFNDSEINGM